MPISETQGSPPQTGNSLEGLSGPRRMRPCHLDKARDLPRIERLSLAHTTSQADVQHPVGLWVDNLFGNHAFKIVLFVL